MITAMRKVRIEANGRDWDLELRYEDDATDSAEVSFASGAQLGRVFKSTYSYSPPTHRGSRVARFHKSVKCWRNEEGPRSGNFSLGFGGDRISHGPYQTRREALRGLIQFHFERGKEEAAVVAFAKRHPEARWKIEGQSADIHIGSVVNLHAGGLNVRSPGRDIKVRLRAIQSDRGHVLYVQLRPRARWKPYVDALMEEQDREEAAGLVKS